MLYYVKCQFCHNSSVTNTHDATNVYSTHLLEIHRFADGCVQQSQVGGNRLDEGSGKVLVSSSASLLDLLDLDFDQ